MDNYLRHNLLNYLNYFGLDSLKDKDIRVSSDERYPGVYNLKYGTLADKSDPIVQACRGAVVEQVLNDGDHSPYFRLVAYAFDRFFNLGEPGAAVIDWDSARVYEKYDGSLIKLFFWNGCWIVSTSGSVGGAGNVGSSEKSFEELFWETFDYCDYRKSDLDSDCCYVFELCAPENRIVVNYDLAMLRLLAVRNSRDDFAELPLDDFESSFWVADCYDFGADNIVDAVNARGTDHEGFIVCDANGNRIKVKSDVYVQLHRVRGNGDPDFSKLWLNDDLDEFLLHFPEYGARFQPLLDHMADLNVFVGQFVDLYKNYNQKEFAEIVLANHPKVSGAMFALRAGKCVDFLHYLQGVSPKKLDELLGLA
jgi:hypothetical protein